MAGIKFFQIYLDCKQHIDMLSDEQAGKIFKSLFDFAISGKTPDFSDGMLTMCFSFLSAQIERDTTKYAEKCEKNRQIALERERRKRERNSTNVQECEQPLPNVHEQHQEKEEEKEKEKEKEKEEEKEKSMSDKSDSTPTPPKSKKKVFGEYSHVKLTDEEYKRLCDDYSEKIILDYIRKIDEYLQMTGKKAYKDYNLAIRKWLNRDNVKGGEENGETPVLRGLVF